MMVMSASAPRKQRMLSTDLQTPDRSDSKVERLRRPTSSLPR
jgi:hypothetical protein